MGDVHRLKINTRTGVFELDGVSIMEQVLECTIHYRGGRAVCCGDDDSCGH